MMQGNFKSGTMKMVAATRILVITMGGILGSAGGPAGAAFGGVIAGIAFDSLATGI
jgi:LytS/YehU family sensor histidine kinase